MKFIMKKIALVLCSFLLAASMATGTGYAHSGRLDSSGGHNKTSNGTYHYHRGSDRSVEYSTKAAALGTSQSSSRSSTSSSSSQPKIIKVEKPYLKLSSIGLFMNGAQMPTFSHSKYGGAYIIVEDLKDYGFDMDWDSITKTLTVINNTEKTVSPLPMSYYNSLGTGYKFFEIEENNPVTVLFKSHSTDSGYSPFTYNCNGYLAVSIDELKAFTQDWAWSNISNCLTVNTKG